MKRAKILKFFLICVVVFFAIASVFAYIFIQYFPQETVLKIIEAQAEKELKRKVVIRELHYGFKGIILNDVVIYNDLTRQETLFSAEEASLTFSLIPLLQKQLIISNITLNKLNINITYVNNEFNIGKLLKSLSDSESSLSTTISEITLRKAYITLKSSPDYLAPLIGSYLIDSAINIKDNNIVLNDFSADLPENRGNIKSDKLTLAILDDNFEIRGDCYLTKCSLLWVYKWGENLDLPFREFTGDVNNLSISKNIIEGEAEGKALLKNSSMIDAAGKCKVNLGDETVSLLDVNGKTGKSSLLLTEFVFSFRGNILRYKIENIDVSFADIRAFLPLPELLYGRASGNVVSENGKLSCKITISDAGFDSKSEMISGINTEIEISINTIKKENLQIMFYKQPCNISFISTDGHFKDIALNINLSEYKPDIDSETKTSFGKINIDRKIHGKIELGKLSIKNINISNINAVYSFDNGILNIDRLTGNVMSGVVQAKGYINIATDSPDVSFNVSADKIKLQDITQLKKDYTGRMFGLAKADAAFKFRIDKNAGILNSLKGNAEFYVDKGKLVNTGIQKGLGVWLEELKYKLTDVEFNKIYGNINVKGNSFDINSFIFNAPDIRFKMEGSVNTDLAGNAKYTLEFNNNFISDVPNITRLFTRPFLTKKGEWYIILLQSIGDDITDSKNIKPQ